MTGFLLAGILSVGFLFASPWPRQASWFKAVMFLKWANDFTVFYLSHMFMTVAVVVLLITHPVPGLTNAHHQSTTWAYMAAGLVAYLAGNILQTFRCSSFRLCSPLQRPLQLCRGMDCMQVLCAAACVHKCTSGLNLPCH